MLQNRPHLNTCVGCVPRPSVSLVFSVCILKFKSPSIVGLQLEGDKKFSRQYSEEYLASFCGDNDVIMSTRSEMIVTFLTDSSINYRGFIAEYKKGMYYVLCTLLVFQGLGTLTEETG